MKEEREKYRINPRRSQRLNRPSDIYEDGAFTSETPRFISFLGRWYKFLTAGFLIEDNTIAAYGERKKSLDRGSNGQYLVGATKREG